MTDPRVIRTTGGLFDQATGRWIGVVDANGDEQVVLTPGERTDLLGQGVLSGVVYDASNRATAWRIDDTNYTASYSPTEVIIAGSDGSITRLAVDPANRLTGVSIA